MSSQARRERALSDRTPPQRPGMGSRTSSAPAGGLHKLDPSRRSAPNVGNPLMEEEEASPGETNNMSKRSRSRQPGDEVRGVLSQIQFRAAPIYAIAII